MKLNVRNEKTILQEELKVALQKVQLLEVERRDLQQQLDNSHSFTKTKIFRDMESVKKDNHYEELLEQSKLKIRDLTY